jgi:hypothetical protein
LRSFNPVEIDTTHISNEEVVTRMLSYLNGGGSF